MYIGLRIGCTSMRGWLPGKAREREVQRSGQDRVRCHDVGEMVLKNVAQRILSCARKAATTARLGGDEFVVLLEGLSGDVEMAATESIPGTGGWGRCRGSKTSAQNDSVPGRGNGRRSALDWKQVELWPARRNVLQLQIRPLRRNWLRRCRGRLDRQQFQPGEIAPYHERSWRHSQGRGSPLRRSSGRNRSRRLADRRAATAEQQCEDCVLH
jgi:hypothetical protein